MNSEWSTASPRPMIDTVLTAKKLTSVLVYGGVPLSARHVIDGITRQLEG
jgi:hypothetical protein